MPEEDVNYQEIRQRIERRYNNRIEFYSHLASFVIVGAVVWFLWLSSAEPRSEILKWIITLGTGGWLAGLVAHGIVFYMKEAKERAIETAVERERLWRGEKPKRDHLRLSSEGELLDVVEDDNWADNRKANRQ